MKFALAPLALLGLASIMSAQGTAWYVPTNTPSTGTCNVIPWGSAPSATWSNQRYQSICTAAQLGNAAGVITGVGFAPCGGSAHTSTYLRIRLAHVPAGFNFTGGGGGTTNFDNNVTVVGTDVVTALEVTDYVWTLTPNTWSSVGLDLPFFYNGTDDLLFDMTVESNSGSTGMHRDTLPRLYATSWPAGSPPATGSTATGALKIKIFMGVADATLFGSGCNRVELGVTGTPELGQSFSIDMTGGAPSLPASLNLGLTNAFPFPIDLGPAIGATGCWWLCDLTLGSVAGLTDPAGAFSVGLTVPTLPALSGFRAYGQFVHVDPSVPGVISTSNGCRLDFGPPSP